MAVKKGKKIDFSTLCIIIGVLFVVLSIIWLTAVNIFYDDESNEITWVG